MATKHTLAPQPDDPGDGVQGFYFDYIEGHARYLGGRLSQNGKGLESRLGDTLKETIEKWLVRETLLQNDRAIARRAALEYRQLRRAQEVYRQNRRNARLPRPSKDIEIITRILRGNSKLTWKQVSKRAAQLQTPVKEVGLKDRVSRIRKALAMEASEDVWLSQPDAT